MGSSGHGPGDRGCPVGDEPSPICRRKSPRDLLSLVPGWPGHRVLELAPASWRVTLEKREAQEALAANVLRRAVLGSVECLWQDHRRKAGHDYEPERKPE